MTKANKDKLKAVLMNLEIDGVKPKESKICELLEIVLPLYEVILPIIVADVMNAIKTEKAE